MDAVDSKLICHRNGGFVNSEIKRTVIEMPPKKNWLVHKVPENTQQRLSYMSACQEWFAHTTEPQMPLENSCVRVVDADAVESFGGVLENVFHDSNQIICLGSNQTSTCLLCSANISATNLSSSSLNPFSNIHCLNCKRC